MKIIFMGTPDFAAESLKAIYEAGHEILSVVTNPDRPKGRGMKLIATPVKQYAQEKKIKIYQPQKVKGNTEFIEGIKSQKPDVICVVAYGKRSSTNTMGSTKWRQNHRSNNNVYGYRHGHRRYDIKRRSTNRRI